MVAQLLYDVDGLGKAVPLMNAVQALETRSSDKRRDVFAQLQQLKRGPATDVHFQLVCPLQAFLTQRQCDALIERGVQHPIRTEAPNASGSAAFFY